jgi:nucleoside-diphosphate-sugar epimerase
MGAINVLGMAKRCRAKVLQASTSEVYGDPEVHPQPESYRGSVNTIGPRACYDEGKRCRRDALHGLPPHANGVNVRIVRIFNTYGPRMHPLRRARDLRLFTPRNVNDAERGIETRSVSEAKSLRRPRLRFGLRCARE